MMMQRMLAMHEFIHLLASYSMRYNAMINNDLMHIDVRVIHLDIVSFTHTTYIYIYMYFKSSNWYILEIHLHIQFSDRGQTDAPRATRSTAHRQAAKWAIVGMLKYRPYVGFVATSKRFDGKVHIFDGEIVLNPHFWWLNHLNSTCLMVRSRC